MIKKLFFLYFTIIFGSIASAQLSPLSRLIFRVASAGVESSQADKLLFKKIHFDNSYSIVGICFDCDSTFKYNLFSFKVDGINELKSIKEKWTINKHSDLRFDRNKNIYKIFVLKDKQVEQYFDMFPSISNIIVSNEYYKFDNSFILEAAAKFPLKYKVNTDTFRSVYEYKSFSERVKTNNLFLFLIEPNVNYKGSFELTIDKKLSSEPDDNIISKLDKYCKKINEGEFYKIYKKNDSSNLPNEIVFVIESDKAFYDNFDNDNFIKHYWIPNKLIVKSYWVR